MADVHIRKEGLNLYVFSPTTNEALDWMLENLLAEEQWIGDSCVIEHGYAREVAEIMLAEGFTIE